ncbi:MAG TPA: hypothetical protein VF735_08925 [Pyrinomonadaceae bacterium]
MRFVRSAVSTKPSPVMTSHDCNTPFQAFVARSRLGHEAHRFRRYVHNAGGSVHTDEGTLKLLFDIWEEKGRP